MIQVVFVKWGNKYGPHYIKGLLAAIRRHTEEEIRPLCITDDPAGLPEDVTTVPFPDFGLPLDDLIGFGGCFPKLSIFAEGILEPDLKTIYFDIDTAVLGDVARLTELLDDHPCLYGLANHIVPTWRTPRLQKYTADGHFFINSSVMVFYPRRHGSIFTDFLEQYPEYLSKEKKPKTASPDDFGRTLYQRTREGFTSGNTLPAWWQLPEPLHGADGNDREMVPLADA